MEEEKYIPSAFTRGLILGIIISIGIAVAIIMLVLHTYSTDIFFAKLISPLIVSAATLGAALSAIYSVKKNIENQNRLHQDIQERKLFAARASLPIALREIERICASAIVQLCDSSKIDNNKPMLINDTSHNTIKLVIEHESEKTRKHLANLLMYFQIAISRFNNYKIYSRANPGMDHLHNEEITESIIHWASLRAIASAHLNYARGISQEFDNDEARKIYEEDFPGYKEQGRYKEIDIRDFNKIFGAAMEEDYPGFLDPNFFN